MQGPRSDDGGQKSYVGNGRTGSKHCPPSGGLPCFENSLPVRATSQQSSDFIMVAQERNKQLIASVLENESEIAVAATLKKFVRQLANTEAAMDMGLAKTPDEITKRQ